MIEQWQAGRTGRTGTPEQGEVQLLESIAQGDRAAFQVLYRAYFQRPARFLDRMVRSPTLIEEIINDTLLVVWQKADRFDASCKVSTWIFAIAYRQGLKALGGVDVPVESDADALFGDVRSEPEHALLRLQRHQEVERALHELPIEQRVVVCLSYYHDMGYQEIAETMGCPLGTVKTRMFHARQRLRALLSDQMEELS
ncbi:MAG: RNA polymerase sigma factor [Gammaproteobacteria bacterium]